MAENKGAADRRKARVRRAIRKAANGRPRLVGLPVVEANLRAGD